MQLPDEIIIEIFNNIDNPNLLTKLCNTHLICNQSEILTNVFLNSGMKLYCIWTHYIQHNYLNGIKYLIQKKFYTTNETLLYSASNGNLEIVKYLVENTKFTQEEYNDSLWHSAEEGHLEVVKYLVKHGADIYILDLEMHFSADDNEIVKYIIEQKTLFN
jgi:hypothetical protein